MTAASETAPPAPPRASLRLDLIVPAVLTIVMLPVSLVALTQPAALELPMMIVAALLFVGLHLASFLAASRPVPAFTVASALMLVLAVFPVVTGVSAAMYPSALAFLLCLYQVTTRAPWRWAIVALSVGIVGSGLVALTATDLVEPLWKLGAFFGCAAMNVATWAFGVLQRMRRAQAAERERVRLREALDADRARISAELHDVVAHSLTVMLAQAEVARGFLREQPEVSDRALGIVLDSGREALRGMRGIVRDDAPREPLPSFDDLDGLLDGARSPDTTIERQETGARGALGTPALLALMPVAREAITNAIRHTAAPRRVRVHLAWEPATLTVTIDDDGGSGASGAALGAGTGLAGLRERVRLAGGELVAGLHGDGWRVRATLPTTPIREEEA